MHISPRTASHPKGWRIEFHPGPHDYIMDGQRLTSVTTLIQKWFPQFKSEEVARKKAAREGGNFEALVAEWARKRDESAAFGTKIHAMADQIIQTGDPSAASALAVNAREKAYLKAVQDALERIARGYDFVESEKIVFSPTRGIAGTVDLLLRSKATGEYVVADWKTNRELKYQGYGGEMGFGICGQLANCNFNHYSLQISAYGELLAAEGYLAESQSVRGVLLHLNERGSGVICDYVKTKELRRIAVQVLDGALPGVT